MMNQIQGDDLMLNIQTSTPKPNRAKEITNKVLVKKEKYRRKVKEQSSMDIKKVSIEGKKKLIKREESIEQRRKVKRRKIPEVITEQVKQVKQEKRSESIIKFPTKNNTVSEIMPEPQNQQHFIDKANIDDFELLPQLKSSLIANGIEKLTEIQAQCYQTILRQRDSIIKARTGSGKTLAYLIPLINTYLEKKWITERADGITMMVICPTRQLCIQGQKEAMRCLKRAPFIVAGSLIGGQQTNHEKARIRKGVNILFCTPGRILYHLQNTQSMKLSNLKTIIFEEADRTLDMGFEATVSDILTQIASKIEFTHIQKLLVSAHFNTKVTSLLQNMCMSEPFFLGFKTQPESIESLNQLNEEINTSEQLKQQYVLMSQEEKISFLLAYLGLIREKKVLIFVSTIDQVEFLECLLMQLKFRDSHGVESNLKVEERPIFKIHGNLDQKLRTKTYTQFRASKSAIMISTEVASRGLDFPDLSHIILFDVPPTITDYGNQVGRSARFNYTGVSLLFLHYQESDYAEKIRYHSPNLQVLNKDTIFQHYRQNLAAMNIGDKASHYFEGLIRSIVKDDDEKYQVGRKAYVSMLRAYSRLKDKHIFAVKKLNLKMLARGFGLNSAKNTTFSSKNKLSHQEIERKKRKVQSVQKLQVSQYL